jgi:hypothetical protein
MGNEKRDRDLLMNFQWPITVCPLSSSMDEFSVLLTCRRLYYDAKKEAWS